MEITCEFCYSVYTYDKVDITALFKGAVTAAIASSSAGDEDDTFTRH